jgi:cell division protein ZapA
VSSNEPAKSEPVTVRILDREYTVGVSEAERASLTSAARMLDLRMREIRGGNKLVAPDRLAVLTALNLAHELQQLRDERGGNEAAFKLLDAANAKLDALLGPTG